MMSKVGVFRLGVRDKTVLQRASVRSLGMSFLTLIGSMSGLIVPNLPPTAVSQHLFTGVSVLQASVDPFNDPVFTSAAAAVKTHADSAGLHFTPVVTGESVHMWDWDANALLGRR